MSVAKRYPREFEGLSSAHIVAYPSAKLRWASPPEVGRARQNPFCERQDAFHVEFFELVGVTVHPRERERLAQFAA